MRILCLLVIISSLLFSCTHDFYVSNESLNKDGLILFSKKEYKGAESKFQNAINNLEKSLNSDSKKIRDREYLKRKNLLAQSYKNLAMLYFDTGKYSLAVEFYEKAIENFSSSSGMCNDFIANCLHALATCFFKQENYLEAEQYYKKELLIEQNIRKKDNLRVAAAANNLAEINQKLGNSMEAEKYFKWALNYCQKCKLGANEEKQAVIDIYNNLALFYERQGNYALARESVQKALDLEAKRSKNFSESRIRSLLVLAGISKETYNIEEAKSEYQECISLIDKSDLQSDNLFCDAYDKYADLLLLERNFREAEPIYQKCVFYCEKAHGQEHPIVAERLSDLSMLYRRTNRPQKAEELLRRALAIQENTIGLDTHIYLETVNRLASVLSDQENFEEADKIFKEIAPKLKEKIGSEHPYLADTFDNWANYVGKLGDKERADNLHEKARMIRKKLARSLNPIYGPAKD